MKCPKCAAQLLLVQNDYFCLQCGELIYGSSVKGEAVELLQLETTSEPVLRRAILDASDSLVEFLPSGANTSAADSRPAASTAAPLLEATSERGLHEVLSLSAKAQLTTSETAVPPPPVTPTVSPSAAPSPLPPPPARAEPPYKSDLHEPVAAATPEANTVPKPPNVPTPAPEPEPGPVPVIPGTVQPAAASAPPPGPAAPGHPSPPVSLHHWSHNLAFVSVALGVLALANLTVGWYFQDKFYPGVSVGGQQVGGTPLASASSKIGVIKTLDYVDFVVGSTNYRLKAADLGVEVDTASIIERAKQIGHDAPFPMMGLYQSLRGQSVTAVYAVDEKIFESKVAQIAAEQSHAATPARALVVGSNVVSLSDKAGQQVEADKLAAGIKSAIRTQTKVVIDAAEIEAPVKLDTYKADIDAVQARLGLAISIKIKLKTITVPASEIAKWVGFGEPGSGALINQARIADYVGTLGSGFDRAAAVTALAATLNSGTNLAYTANIKKTTALPKPAAGDQAPVRLQYCIASMGATDGDISGLAAKLESTYADSRGWGLGGLILYNQVASGCNYTVWLVLPSAMDSFSPACHNQSTCRVGNNVVLNRDNWNTPPNNWTGTAEDYRSELINHETGHWLGFDHLACGKGATAPIQATNVLIWGCSPNWWSVPAELQDIKVLAGF